MLRLIDTGMDLHIPNACRRMPLWSSDIAEISCVNFLVLFLPLDQYPSPRFRCMPICQDCGSNFPLLKTDVCNKCRMLEGQSPVEKTVIKASLFLQVVSFVNSDTRSRYLNF